MTSPQTKPSINRRLLRAVLYPWAIWSLCAAGPVYLRRRFFKGSRLWANFTLFAQLLLYLLIGLPLTLAITVVLLVELTITANQQLMTEQADYRLHSDWKEDPGIKVFEVPGPKSYRPPPVEPGPTEEYRRYLVELYSPVVYQIAGSQPAYDIPILVDYDGNDDPRDNVENASRFESFTGGVYGEVTGVTADSFYLTYSLYHVKDYDHPIRQAVNRWTYHDNDNEGYHIRIDRQTMEIAEVETWFHNRFLLFNHTGQSTGTEPVHGKIYTEDGTHLIIYVQPQGHGVRLAQLVDLPTLRKRVKIMRYRGDRPVVKVRGDASTQIDATYELDNFDLWYATALGPYGKDGGMFAETILLGDNPDGSPRAIGRFVAGRDYDNRVDAWSRPKPMWSWDDAWDDIPIFFWHFFPSVSFQSHGGSDLSHDYEYNEPCEKVFAEDVAQVFASINKLQSRKRRGDKWEKLKTGGGTVERAFYWTVFRQQFAGYINYVFRVLG